MASSVEGQDLPTHGVKDVVLSPQCVTDIILTMNLLHQKFDKMERQLVELSSQKDALMTSFQKQSFASFAVTSTADKRSDGGTTTQQPLMLSGIPCTSSVITSGSSAQHLTRQPSASAGCEKASVVNDRRTTATVSFVEPSSAPRESNVTTLAKENHLQAPFPMSASGTTLKDCGSSISAAMSARKAGSRAGSAVRERCSRFASMRLQKSRKLHDVGFDAENMSEAFHEYASTVHGSECVGAAAGGRSVVRRGVSFAVPNDGSRSVAQSRFVDKKANVQDLTVPLDAELDKLKDALPVFSNSMRKVAATRFGATAATSPLPSHRLLTLPTPSKPPSNFAFLRIDELVQSISARCADRGGFVAFDLMGTPDPSHPSKKKSDGPDIAAAPSHEDWGAYSRFGIAAKSPAASPHSQDQLDDIEACESESFPQPGVIHPRHRIERLLRRPVPFHQHGWVCWVLQVIFAMLAIVEFVCVMAILSTKNWNEPPSTWEVALSIILTIVYFIFIAFQFCVSRRKQWTLHTTFKEVGYLYLRTWFIFDLMLTFPYDLLSLIFTTSAFRGVGLIRCLRVVRLFRLFQSSHPLKPLDGKARVFVTALCVVAVIMLVSVVWIWTEPQRTSGSDTGELLMDSAYWAVTTLSTTGYGDIVPKTPAQKAYCIVIMMLGSTLFGYIVGNLSMIMWKTGIQNQQENERKQRLLELLEFYNVPWNIQQHVMSLFPYLQRSMRATQLQSDVINLLPISVQNNLIRYMKLELLSTVPFFKGSEMAVFDEIADRLVEVICPPGDIIIRTGEYGEEMFFIADGLVEVLLVNEHGDLLPIANLHQGQFFGEIALFLRVPRTATVRAITPTTLFTLHVDDFQDVLDKYPKLHEAIEREAMTRMEAVKKQTSANQSMSQRPPPSVLHGADAIDEDDDEEVNGHNVDGGGSETNYDNASEMLGSVAATEKRSAIGDRYSTNEPLQSGVGKPVNALPTPMSFRVGPQIQVTLPTSPSLTRMMPASFSSTSSGAPRLQKTSSEQPTVTTIGAAPEKALYSGATNNQSQQPMSPPCGSFSATIESPTGRTPLVPTYEPRFSSSSGVPLFSSASPPVNYLRWC